MASEARPRSPQDGVRRRRDFNRSAYVTLGAVRYAVRRAPPPSRCPCRCCADELLGACLGRDEQRRTLERLQRFRFGRAPSGERERRAGSADRPRPDRTERLRELTKLTNRLRGAPPPPPPQPHSAPVLPPVPPPRTRHTRASPAREPSLCCTSPPSNPRSRTEDRTSEDERDSGTREDFFDADDIRLMKVEPRSIVGSYAQKTIPFRSASFSQGDFASEKYYRERGGCSSGPARQPSIFDFNRRPASKSADSTGVRVSLEPRLPRDAESSSVATEETVTEGGSTASVDSAVGSDEGLLAHASPAPRSPPPDGTHKQLGTRSLTHPLPRRGSQERAVPGGSLQFLATPRTLHKVREESDVSLADSAQPQSEGVSPLESAPAFDFPPAAASSCANVDCDCSRARVQVSSSDGAMRTAVACAIPVPVYECIVKEWSTSIDNDGSSPSDASVKEDETITSEQVESILAAVQNPSTPAPLIGCKDKRRPHDKMKRRKGIYITNEVSLEELPAPVVNGDFARSEESFRRRREDVVAPGSGEIEVCVSSADPRDSINSSEARTSSSVFGDKSDDSAANGPPSPVEAPPPPAWPRGELDARRRRSRLSHQSSDERDEDPCRRAHRKVGVAVALHADSPPSDGESESGASARDRAPSPFSPSDVSDAEARGERLRRPVPGVRGPYGRMLDARQNRPFDAREGGRRSYSDATVPHRKASAGCAPRAAPTHVRATSSPSKLAVLRGPSGGADLLAELLRGSSEALSNTNNFPNVILHQHQYNDTRTHVVVELYDTERSYVEALQTLVKKYLLPLKSPENAGLVDAFLVDEIFHQVPAILAVHEVFLGELTRRLDQWDACQRVGDVFLNVFAKPSVMDTYMSFINNWKKAKETIKATKLSRPAFARFLDNMARDHKGKLSLDHLLIKPVQKFPSYELLIQRLIKHTEPAHPDHKLLQDAQKEIHELLLKINCTERASLELEQQQLCLRELEQLIEGLSNLVSPERAFVAHETASMPSATGAAKDRALFLFSDLMLITSVKRRTGTIKKPIPTYQSSVASQMEGSKYKLLMRIALSDLEVLKAKDEKLCQLMQEVDTLVDDVNVLTQISDLTAALHLTHAPLEDMVREMLCNANRQLSDRQNSDTQLCCLELSVNTANGTENLMLIFSKTETRSKWEALLTETKEKLTTVGHERRREPVFLSPVPIRKTRAGLQFTCAAPTLPPPGQSPDVWVCNSDGYVGQVCVLTLSPKPQVTSCNGVCNARILCIACVPPAPAPPPPHRQSTLDIPVMPSAASGSVKPGISISDADDSCKNIRLDSSSSSDDEEEGSSNSDTADAASDTRSQDSSTHPGISSLHSSGLASARAALTPSHAKSLSTPHTGQNISVHPVMKSSSNPAVDKQAMGITSVSGRAMLGTVSSPASRQSSEEAGAAASQPTMWVGTEDGYIHLYSCSDNVRIKRSKARPMQHNSTVLRIVYLDGKVFVALGNGDIVVYHRDIDCNWVERCTLAVGSGTGPVSSTLLYEGRLWCATHTTIKILNPQTLQIEDAFQVCPESLKPISNMAIHGAGIWLSLSNTAHLKCYHARTREQLADINITPWVTKVLHGCDDIIRQHKAACLRVTSLLAWHDTLWVGTSAGVLLNAELQHSPDASGNFAQPRIYGVNFGHTGHVRFITRLENPNPLVPDKPSQGTSKTKAASRRSANAEKPEKPPEAAPEVEILVISGGDGFEDFRASTSAEDAGREDSTNHLLLWKV